MKYFFSSSQAKILQSFLPVSKDSHFPIQNIPFGIYSPKSAPNQKHICIAIGDYVLDLPALVKKGLFQSLPSEHQKTLLASTLNNFFSLPKKARAQIRQHIQTQIL
jgi:fumarylacetoacetase